MDVVKSLLSDLGGWPVLEGNDWDENNNFAWTTTMYSFRKAGLEVDTLMDLTVGFDLKNSSRRMVQVIQRFNSKC